MSVSASPLKSPMVCYNRRQVTERARRTLRLNAIVTTIGRHDPAWRFSESSLLGTWDLKHDVRRAHAAERGTFDAIFFEE